MIDEKNVLMWTVDKKNTDAHRKNVIIHMKLSYGEDLEGYLPPIFFKDMDELSNEEIRLLDNLIYMFFKGEVCGNKL